MQRIRKSGLALVAVCVCIMAAACAGGGAPLAAPAPAADAALDASPAAPPVPSPLRPGSPVRGPAETGTGSWTGTPLAPPGPTLGSQRAGELHVWLASTPEQPVRGTALVDAYLVDSAGQAITDAKVTFDTDMTNMSHGQYLVPAEGAGDGHYAGQVHFSMAGPWRIIAIVERPGRETARLRFEFRVGAQ